MTLNQIITRLQKIAEAHRLINHFFIGSYDDFKASKDIEYPCLFVELQEQGTIDKSTKQITFNFRFWFLDLLNVATESKENEFELYSDLLQIAQDYLALLHNPDYDDWTISQSNQLSFGSYQLQDVTAGVDARISISIRNLTNRCQVPTDGTLPTQQDPQMQIISNYVYTANGNEGYTKTFTNLRYKNILMVFLGDKPLKKVDIINNPNEFTYDLASGQFSFGVDLQPEQVLQILHNTLI